MVGLDVKELVRAADAFERRVDEIKDALAPDGIVWYPYRTLSVFSILDKFLTGPNRRVLDLAGGDPILDLGCGDGAVAFFLESLGCEVLAVDNPHVNHNHMRGFTALRASLGSSVAFQAVDLDSQFALPGDVFGLAVFLGVLYHLKNPYYVLEALATRARYCLLSTRIAQRTPKGAAMKGESLAYLLAPGETNRDPTNYWIFSETALRRLVERIGWKVCDYVTVGVTRGSEPAREDRDERAFCLLQSDRCPRFSVSLLEGWHALEQNSFRWTERRFSILLKRPLPLKVSDFHFAFRLVGDAPVKVSARVNEVNVPSETFVEEGEHCFRFKFPREAVSPTRIDFSVDKCVAGGVFDERELGLLVAFWEPGREQADPTLPFRLS